MVKPRAALTAIGLALLLSGCISDQKKQLAACELDATRAHPGDTDEYTREGQALEFVIDNDIDYCMTAHGYDGDLKDDDCQATLTSEPFSKQPYCYVPSGYLDRLEFRGERWLELQMRKANNYPNGQKAASAVFFL